VKQVAVCGGYVALVDDEDHARVVAYGAWSLHQKGYAVTTKRIDGRKIHVRLHRFVMGNPVGRQVDHRNGNRLDCRNENLRLATHGQNQQNSYARVRAGKCTSAFKGVHWDPTRQRWTAQIRKDGKTIALGRFRDEEGAARAVDTAARKLHGEFARFNFPRPGEPSARLEHRPRRKP
jgi:hypothetical protein